MNSNHDYQKELYDMFEEFRIPREDATYPPYHEGKYLEEYFCNKYLLDQPNSNRYFVPIHWTAVFNYRVKEGLTKGSPNHALRLRLMQSISSLNPNYDYFTVSTHDDAPLGTFPEGTINFSAGGNSQLASQVPIPLIASGFKSFNDFQKMLFASFIGSLTHPIRNTSLRSLVQQPGYFIKVYEWEPEVSSEKATEFKAVMEQSRFSLCPRGYGATSYRMYEAIQMGSIPVYISDKHLLPWSDELNWKDFAVIVEESNIENIDTILKTYTETDIRNMQTKLKEVYDVYFTIPSVYNQIIKRI